MELCTTPAALWNCGVIYVVYYYCMISTYGSGKTNQSVVTEIMENDIMVNVLW